MTKERFRQLVKRLHPDKGGNGHHAYLLRTVLERWRQQKAKHSKRYKKCHCGATIDARATACNLHMRRPRQKRAAIRDESRTMERN